MDPLALFGAPSFRAIRYTNMAATGTAHREGGRLRLVSTPRSSCFHELNHDIMNYFAASVAGPESTPVIAQSDR